MAPGFKCDLGELKKGIQKIESWGLTVRRPKALFGPDVICANSDKVRFETLKKAFENPDSDIVWCVRGGYGSLRLLSFLNTMKKPKKKKILIGYSDITTLHSFVRMRWGWTSLHAPLVDGIGAGKSNLKSLAYLKKIIYNKKEEIVFDKLKPLNQKAKQSKVIKGKVVGGNLSVLVTQIGTRWQEDLKGKILFLEDIGERGYAIDRMLLQMQMSGFLKSAKAIVFGEFTGGAESNGKLLWKPVMERFAKSMQVPVLSGIPCGHGKKQMPLVLNSNANLKLGRRPELKVSGIL